MVGFFQPSHPYLLPVLKFVLHPIQLLRKLQVVHLFPGKLQELGLEPLPFRDLVFNALVIPLKLGVHVVDPFLERQDGTPDSQIFLGYQHGKVSMGHVE